MVSDDATDDRRPLTALDDGPTSSLSIIAGVTGNDDAAASRSSIGSERRDACTSPLDEQSASAAAAAVAIQVPERTRRGIQTTTSAAAVVAVASASTSPIDRPSWDDGLSSSLLSDDAALRSSLRRTSRAMLSELERAVSESNAFLGYELLEDDDDERHPIGSSTSPTNGTAEHRYALSWKRSKKRLAEDSVADRAAGKPSSFYAEDEPDENHDLDATMTSRNGRSSRGGDGADEEGLGVTGVAWSASEFVLAAVYGGQRPNGEEGGRGAIVLWDLSSRDFDPGTPSREVRHSSSLLCIAAHPEKPSVFAAGSYYGEVVLYDFASSSTERSEVAACSRIGEYFHMEPVTSVRWVRDSNSQGSSGGGSATGREWLLCSIGGDGKALFWNPTNKLKYPDRGIRLLRAGCPRAVGGTAIAVPPPDSRDQNVFIGTEGGAVLRASFMDEEEVEGKKETARRSKPPKIPGCAMKWSSNALQTMRRIPLAHREKVARSVEERAKLRKRKGIDNSAVYDARPPMDLIYPASTDFEYATHTGRVVSLDHSPFRRNLFLSGGYDGLIRLYDALDQRPVLEIDTAASLGTSCASLFEVRFSPVRSSVLAAAFQDGLRIYDLETSTHFPAAHLTVPLDASDTPPAMTCVAFNSRVRNLLAGGDRDGVVHVWRIPNNLCAPRINTDVLENLMTEHNRDFH